MSEKELKSIEDNEVDEVAGGYLSSSGHFCCNICCKLLADKGGGLPLSDNIHICDKCIDKYRQLMGPEAFSQWLNNPKTLEGLSNNKWAGTPKNPNWYK